MPTTIYLVRHGQAENKEGIMYGRMPGFNLSEQGREESKRIGKLLSGEKISHIYTSPLERAYQTADIIASSFPKATIEHLYDLIEIDATKWQSLKPAELAQNVYYEKLLNDPANRELNENLEDLSLRMQKVIKKILEKHPGERIVCVSHELPILALKLSLEKTPLKTLKTHSLPTGGMVKLVFNSENKLISSETVAFPGT